jgi:hypothetical protein
MPPHQNVHLPPYQRGYSPRTAVQNSQAHLFSDHDQRPSRFYRTLGSPTSPVSAQGYQQLPDQPPPLSQEQWGSERVFGDSHMSASPTQSPQSPSKHSDSQPTFSPPANPYAPVSPSKAVSPGPGPTDRTHMHHLQVRSRSPISYSPAMYQDSEPLSDQTDPASTLGTFQSAVPETPRVGDQETPWNITLPDEDEQKPSPGESPSQDPSQYPLPDSTLMSPINPSAENLPPPPPPKIPLDSPSSSTLPAPPSSSATPAPGPASQHSASPAPVVPPTPAPVVPPTPDPVVSPATESVLPTANYRQSADGPVHAVELPARVPGDESSEEIVMSSTSYPGQEWQPSYLGNWD